jgi:hypothetical protein
MTACTTICSKNINEGLPVITCQPMNTAVNSMQDAHFEVEAEGPNLSFQWFFESTNSISAITGETSPQLTVSKTNMNRCGFYWCLIDAEGPNGRLETRTRQAELTTRSLLVSALEQEPLKPGTAGSNLCANPICGFVNFNNYSSEYKPAPGQVHCAIKLTADSAGLTPIDILTYEAQYRYGGQPNQCGCLTNFPPDQKGFKVPVGTAAYAFTVYFKSACPLTGTPFYLKVTFGP